MMQPTSPIDLTGTASRFANPVALPDGFTTQLAELCATVSDVVATAEASRDWWPLAMHWSLAGQVPQRAAVIARPTSTAEVAAVLALCNRTGVAVTPAGGRRRRCGPWRIRYSGRLSGCKFSENHYPGWSSPALLDPGLISVIPVGMKKTGQDFSQSLKALD